MGAAEKIPKDFMLEFPRPVKTYHREPYPRLNPRNSSFKGAGKTVLVTAGGKTFLQINPIDKLVDDHQVLASASRSLGRSLPQAFPISAYSHEDQKFSPKRSKRWRSNLAAYTSPHSQSL